MATERKIKCVISETKFLAISEAEAGCQGVDPEDNRKRVREIAKHIQGLQPHEVIYIGDDFNAHIWEMDGVENENGRIMRSLVESSELDIMNVIWQGLEGPTWERKTSSYCLDYVFLNNAGLNLIKDAWKLSYDELVESDHKAICLSIGWKAAKKDNKRRRKHQRLRKYQIIEYRERVEERTMEEQSLQEIMLAVAENVSSGEGPMKWNREWWDLEVEEAVKKKRNWCRRHRQCIKRFGEEHEETKETWRRYRNAKTKAQALVARKVEQRNRRFIQALGRGRRRTERLFHELKKWTRIGNGRKDRVTCLLNDDGVKEEMQKVVKDYWMKVLNSPGDARMGITKERKEMVEGYGNITGVEVDRACKEIALGKAGDESGVFGEYIHIWA
ncbi:hypothetical protein CAPTEDRAFT_212534 [Capitella teleta]|uniref:Endonuclease/exonuclease/phosphatase domain-containing protein n=1 Tax=Capitella teleta TaxID=283909 RepID=R7T7S1_CAPTE|nr:hypothetical protein CAPTEDRAFT_212534 [Capitella teleta]|eukprot:ELT89483.1 hypothetical protein CAPTEDRAFT_212534 [Capitella teleta]